MMKELILVGALVLIAGLGFAQEIDGEEAFTAPDPEPVAFVATTTEAPAPVAAAVPEEKKQKPNFFNLELTLGVPIHWTNSPTQNQVFGDSIDLDKTITANSAFGFALLFNFNSKIGLTLDTDFFFGTSIVGGSNTSSFSNSLFGANAFLGPVFFLYDSENLRIPLAVGAHAYYWRMTNWYPADLDLDNNTGSQLISSTDLQFGPAFYIGMQFHFDNKLYLFSRTNVSLSVYRMLTIETVDANGVEGDIGTMQVNFAWHVKPTLGLGIKF